jgi:hypothetical protein
MAEFMTMVRGCNLIAGNNMMFIADSVFNVRTTFRERFQTFILTYPRRFA